MIEFFGGKSNSYLFPEDTRTNFKAASTLRPWERYLCIWKQVKWTTLQPGRTTRQLFSCSPLQHDQRSSEDSLSACSLWIPHKTLQSNAVKQWDTQSLTLSFSPLVKPHHTCHQTTQASFLPATDTACVVWVVGLLFRSIGIFFQHLQNDRGLWLQSPAWFFQESVRLMSHPRIHWGESAHVNVIGKLRHQSWRVSHSFCCET